MFVVPDHLRMGAVHRRVALESGVSRDVLEGVQFRRLHEAVYVHRDHEMTWTDHLEAARLALPTTARTTGVTRLRQLGLDVGSAFPLHFVIEGDHHLVLDGVFLHRTVKMPACDEVGATVEAAFVAFCAEARLIDAIGVGSYLLHEELLDLRLLDLVLTEEKWRRGVPEAVYALPHLEGRCRSIPEARLFACVVFASLPVPEVNRSLRLDDGVELTPDLWFEDHGLVVEYEGAHHQDDRAQYNADIDRYALYRRHDVPYELVTKERMRSPKATMRRLYAALVSAGYDGPPPEFGELWDSLFLPLPELVRRRRG